MVIELATLWSLPDSGEVPLSCRAYAVEDGLELRVSDAADKVVRAERFRGPNARHELEARAESLRHVYGQQVLT